MGTHSLGSVQQVINLRDLKRIEVPVPPLPEQRAIAHVLGTLDDKIELNRRMCETLEAMARALFQSWFVDFEPVRAKMEGRWRPGESLPGLRAQHYHLFPDTLVPSSHGDIPEGWEVRTLGEVVEHLRDIENPQMFRSAMFSHYSIPAYDAGKVPIDELGADIKSTKTRVQPGVILVSKLNPEIERVWLADVDPQERAICSTEFLVFRPNAPFRRIYAYCLARSPDFRDQIASLVTGTSKSHQRAPINAILSLECLIPSAQVLASFEEKASIMLEKTLRGRRESTVLAAQRDALLPRLVSGEVRVEVEGSHANNDD